MTAGTGEPRDPADVTEPQAGHESGAEDAPDEERPPVKEPSSARRMFLASVLSSEVLIVLFAALAAHGLRVADRGLVWAVAGGAVFLCVLATALLGRAPRVSVVLGSLVQVGLLSAALLLPAMAAIGAIFAILWAVSLRVGARIDRERWERYEAELAWHAEHGR